MKRTNRKTSIFCLSAIFTASFVSAQPLPVDLAGNVAGVLPSVRLTKLINSDLKSQSGESLGRVQDVIVDPVTGQVQFAILGTGASSDAGVGTSTTSDIGTTPGATASTAGGQFVAIPWQLVSSSGQGQYVANVDRTKLQSAPTFSSSAWPTIDAAWIQNVNSHYGLSGTSIGRPGSSSGTQTGTGTGIGNPATPGSLNRPGTSAIGSPSGLRVTPGTTPAGGTGAGSGSGASGSGGAGSGSGGGK
jgi:sporulation protein YlmC with PRC-barrel domain